MAQRTDSASLAPLSIWCWRISPRRYKPYQAKISNCHCYLNTSDLHISNMSRLTLTRFARLMHTSGRPIADPGQGGASSIGSTPPSSLPSNIPNYQSDLSVESYAQQALDSSILPPTPSDRVSGPRKYTPKGKPIIQRPARAAGGVYLPSGYPEPDSYPPSEEYIRGMGERKRDAHPLWQFFHVPESSKAALTSETAGPRDGGSLETVSGDDANIKSGKLSFLFSNSITITCCDFNG